MVHVEAELNVSPSYRQTILHSWSHDKFQTNIKEVKVIKEADNYLIAHEVIAGKLIISDRDTVCLYGGEDDIDIGAYLMGPSVEHEDYPSHCKPVRATKHIAGFVFVLVCRWKSKQVYLT